MDKATTEEEAIVCEVGSYVGIVTMRRPPVNAMNGPFFEKLREVFDGVERSQ